MSELVRSNDEMKRFEAELARLVPRGDGLDPAWRERLAEEALAARRSRPADGRRWIAAIDRRCPACGHPIRGGWRWPAAFLGMTAVAASLLLAASLPIESQPRLAEKRADSVETTGGQQPPDLEPAPSGDLALQPGSVETAQPDRGHRVLSAAIYPRLRDDFRNRLIVRTVTLAVF